MEFSREFLKFKMKLWLYLLNFQFFLFTNDDIFIHDLTNLLFLDEANTWTYNFFFICLKPLIPKSRTIVY